MGKQMDEKGDDTNASASASSIASSSDDGSNSKGSNHHIGAAIGGALNKISSPIGIGLRKVVRHDSNHRRDRSVSSSPALNKTKSLGNVGDDSSEKQTPIKDVAEFFGESGKAVKRLVHHRRKDSSRSVPSNDDDDGEKDQDDLNLPPVAPDETLQKMNVIINKRLPNFSVSQYYETVWSEGSADGEDGPLYRSFLEESGKEDIIVGEWEVADNDTNFLGNWDNEKYQKKRTVTFVFDKRIPMQSKPVVAQVKQTHYCRMEGNDKCVVAMTIEMNGVPFSDCFVVEVRWVATRSGKDDISIQVGLFVNFIKSTVLAGKIRNGTTEQTTQSQLVLFDKVQKACGGTAEEVQKEEGATPPSPPWASKLSQDEAGRILILSSCLLLLASQAESLFSHAATQVSSSSAITSALAGLLLMVPNITQMSQKECLVVVVAHLAHGLCSFLTSITGFLTDGVSTVLLMAAWAVLARRVLKQSAPLHLR